jgi:membrane associated rhomboid family serine protease
MTNAAHNPDDYCYRHPDRPSFVLCERCGRTICLECQNHVAGKVLCPDDARRSNVTMMPVNSRPKAPARARREPLLSRVPDSWPLASSVIIGVLLIVFIVDTIVRGALGSVMVLFGTTALRAPWTLVTSMFYPGGILGLAISGVNLFLFGRILEPYFGRLRFLLLYLVSGFGGAVFAFLLDGVSASPYGAISGLLAALVITARRMGGSLLYIYISCAISVALAIYFGSWQVFLGGFVSGAAIGWIYHAEENVHRTRRAVLLVIAVGGVLLVAAFVRAIFFYLS